MKSHVRLHAIVAAVCLLAACGGPQHATSGQARRGKVISVADGATGAFATVAVPIADRASPAVATSPDEIFVYGGYVLSDGRLIGIGDGATSSDSGRTWEPVPDAPFANPLFRPAAAAVGREFVIVGTPCAPTAADSEVADCGSSRPVAAVYSTKNRTWRPLGTVLPHAAVAHSGAPLLAIGRGSIDGFAAFEVEAGARHTMLLVDPSDGATQWLEAPEGADTVCADGASLLAVSTGEDMGGFAASSNAEAVARPISVWRLDVAINKWLALEATEKPASTGAMFERVACSAGSMAYFPVMPAPTGFGTGVLWWDGPTGTWNQVPNIGELGYPGEMAVAQTDHAQVAWQFGAEAFSVRSGDGPWAREPKPTGLLGPVRLRGMRDEVVIDPTGSGAIGPIRLTVFAPNRVAPAGA
jgi:hypothetical protein